MKLKSHVFICTNERPPGHPRGCCKAQGSEELLLAFKKAIAQAGIQAEIRAQKSGCLDVCESGAALVIYPEGVWYGGVKIENVQEIVDSHLVRGQPVEHLRIPGK